MGYLSFANGCLGNPDAGHHGGMTEDRAMSAAPDKFAPEEVALRPRNVQFDWSDAPLHWIPGDPYASTGSLAIAAIAATIGSSIGYYLPAYVNAFRWTWPTVEARTVVGRVVLTNLLAVRSLTMEFGIAEVIDSALVRPGLIFAAPVLLDQVLLGWIVGGFLADVVFYVCTIVSYEKFNRWLARRPEPVAILEPVLP